MEKAALIIALLAAIAAVSSAGAAWTALLTVQRQNLIESVRPELVLKDWTQDEPGTLRFAKLKNIGPGTAFNVNLSALGKDSSGKTVAVLTSSPDFWVVESGQELGIDGTIKLLWDSVQPSDDTKHIYFDIFMVWWDSINQRNEVRQSVMVDYTSVRIGSKLLPEAALPGVNFGPRVRSTESVWWLKQKAQLKRLFGFN